MILNVSGRTDIVALYSEWFMNRYREGFVDVRNPYNAKMISRIYFEDVDAILFCTKNPIPILNHLKEIDKKKAFEKMCSLLDRYVSKIIVSFIDDYKNVRNNEKVLCYKEFTGEDYKAIGISFSESARKHNMTVQTCFEDRNLVEYGFVKGECSSHELAYKITGKTYKNWTARKEKKM